MDAMKCLMLAMSLFFSLCTSNMLTPAPPTTLDIVAATETSNKANQTKSKSAMGFDFYRVCGAAATGELFRFDLSRTCPSTRDKEHKEGILLTYKLNIVPYMFSIRRYRKIITQLTVWRGLTETAITDKFEMSVGVQPWETTDMDSIYQCFNSANMVVNGLLQVYTDRDGVNKTVNIRPVDGLTGNIQRYFSQPDLYSDPGWFPGMYRVRTTVNCEIVDMIARSADPYSYIVTALGDTLEVSPFFSKNSTSLKKDHNLRQVTNYKLVDHANRGVTPKGDTRIFLDTPSATYSWKSEAKKEVTCPIVLWKMFPRVIRTQHEHSFHFVANEVTATFTTPLTQVQNFSAQYSCVESEINETVAKQLSKLNETYTRDGDIEYYQTEGNIFVVWVPLRHLTLEEYNVTTEDGPPEPTKSPTLSRRRRDVSSSNSSLSPAVSKGGESAIVTAQIQFAYDKLTTSVNDVLEELSRAWCREQVRESLVWYELSKVNPTSVMSAIYGRPVSAKYVGDAISITDCIYLDQESVNIHQSMRMQDDETTCYSRPRVTFKFLNSSTVLTGQLGSRKEIILSTANIEPCKPDAEHYFLVGDSVYVYKNYIFASKQNISSIATLDTFIALNLTFIENIDFRTVELYSSAERKLSSVFDIETMFREYNYYTYSLAGLKKDLDNTIDYNRDRLRQDLSDMLADLGDIGKAVVNVVSSVVTVFSSIVTGFIKLFTNPIGGIFILLIIVGIIFLVFILNRRNQAFEQAPIKMLYPSVEQYPGYGSTEAQNTNAGSQIDSEEIKRILAGMHKVHAEEKAAQLALKKSRPSLWQTATDYLRHRRRGYKALNSRAEEAETKL
ncbi:glycoprotein B [Cricetid gammaherpesvirus 2]|uniref:Glycoprotein B n=1 Tax=Cricetid gammaherpesvirus 2 TaxID=1605972 RepID=E9M5J5_9GAMA|nr:glycoprotein B [Cricetid gammaherpesvirus 2]ADW24353.1 glycoprotein B [Cricetid gammaherpesvirus 2]ADW24435.1 glycoprotein B [Cricetid gammaherpesvirus 2]